MTFERIILIGMIVLLACIVITNAIQPNGRYQIASGRQYDVFRIDTRTGEVCHLVPDEPMLLEDHCGKPGEKAY